jgi:hypothetical protein
MAERRMFAKTIIDSDAFLDMPLSTQALYFHLSMRADDEGFINNPKKIQRMIGCSDDDIRVLISKRFVIPFESGIVVIKHWKIHNYIRSDRMKTTVYQEERALLEIKSNKAYTFKKDIPLIEEVEEIRLTDKCQTSDRQTTDKCQHRLGKDRLGKDRLGKDRLGKDRLGIYVGPSDQPEEEVTEKIPFNEIKNLFNKLCPSYSKIISITEKRKPHIRARWNQFKGDMQIFETAFMKLEASDFCKGNNDRRWRASFDWIIVNDTNMVKVLEGKYDNKGVAKAEPKQWNTLRELYKEAEEEESNDDKNRDH